MGSTHTSRGLPMKAVAASAAALSVAVALHFAGPAMLRFASAEVPKIYGATVAWLTPPYLYFVVNAIIISIAASSRLHRSGSEDVAAGSGPGSAAKQEFVVVASPAPAAEEEVKVTVTYVVPREQRNEEKEKEAEEEEEFVISRSSWTPRRREAAAVEEIQIPTPATEKPLVSARLGRRKSLKASPEGGRALRVARPKRNDTLESTWKAITEGRAVPLARHHQSQARAPPRDDGPAMRKSETFKEPRGGDDPAGPVMRKSETFKERRSGASPGAGRLRKEASVGQDELNRRVEAFINKFNEEMRLQRQESFKHYMDMINRGSN